MAIVGSGCAGIAALWALNRSHHDVYMYEADDRLGGHTNTVEWTTGKYKTKVDTGFIVLNAATYRQSPLLSTQPELSPLTQCAANFIKFLEKVKVDAVPTEMTFSVSRDAGLFEWAGTSLDSLFCQRRHLFSPRMWRMIFDIVRFNQFALDLLLQDDSERAEGHDVNGNAREAAKERPSGADETIGQYLEREGYSDAFRDDYLIPMTAAVWSTSPDKCTLEFPAVTLVRFL